MSKRQENILLSMWGVALVATMGSLYFSEIRGYEPCVLCWVQRIFMYPLVIIIGIAYVQKNVKIALTTLVFSVIGGCISLYHYGIQKLDFLSDTAPACGRVPCTGEYINYLGFITIPFLALTAFILIAGMSIYLWKSLKEEK
ncbi:disulfide bond formation protein DsbB [Planococcus glaciei]|jgi:disulfide bond formation protein DsbB|uniref:Disulfide bond formation protein B n=2 Tax=Planococcus TaxID=1372 RepID=A0A7H8QBG1_9BACL|nr:MULTISPECIES: disulfide oxidoreductase [Planococcus]ETP68307.1 dihydroneopterin aldolase [Planococcus glaciei CHR43]KOF10149.1 disulfide bond formation protein DsbB [Planococcus glaciei]MBX0316175.1 disulfide bond formation protein B [Planococcus glaciei]MDN7228583.1 disulfide oxidoreductase [Planococcus sp. N064]QKX51356.1 disulfide bond formation protein B [Planococcus glaciei]